MVLSLESLAAHAGRVRLVVRRGRGAGTVPRIHQALWCGQVVSMEPTQVQLQAFLADSDAPCPSCDYNLRGLKGDICPECSQRLVLRVGLAEPRQRAFIAAVVGLAAGTGFHGLLFVYFLIAMVRWRSGRMEFHFLDITGSFLLIEGIALFFLIRRRRSFQRRSNAFKGWVVAAAWGATI